MNGGGAERERETQNLKQVPGSELFTQGWRIFLKRHVLDSFHLLSYSVTDHELRSFISFIFLKNFFKVYLFLRERERKREHT